MHVETFAQSCGGSRIQTWNRYAYVGNNPTTYNDPSGLVIPIELYLMTGGGSFNSWANSFISGLIAAGAAVFCPQCAPGTPGGPTLVGQGNPGSSNQPVWVPGGCTSIAGDSSAPNCVGPSWMTQQQLQGNIPDPPGAPHIRVLCECVGAACGTSVAD
jgi:hypothetical protein